MHASGVQIVNGEQVLDLNQRGNASLGGPLERHSPALSSSRHFRATLPRRVLLPGHAIYVSSKAIACSPLHSSSGTLFSSRICPWQEPVQEPEPAAVLEDRLRCLAQQAC